VRPPPCAANGPATTLHMHVADVVEPFVTAAACYKILHELAPFQKKPTD
jgi:hypothetical protein